MDGLDLGVGDRVGGSGAESWGSGQVVRRPPRLLVTLLGDYWWRRTEPVPSAALVALLGEFGVSDAAARAALSRLVRNGLLVASKWGRRTCHRLSEQAAAVLEDGGRRIFSFGAPNQAWDGSWSVVTFSVPEGDRRLRHVLRVRLRWLGFAPLYDGVWISPRDNVVETTRELAELGVATATVFRAATVPGSPEAGLPQHAWDIDELAREYEHFLTETEPLQDRALAGAISPVEALIARTQVMDHWRSFPALDPDLPEQLLPTGWPRTRAKDVFIRTYDALGPVAEQRVRQIIARYAPDLAELATHHRSADTLAAAEQEGAGLPGAGSTDAGDDPAGQDGAGQDGAGQDGAGQDGAGQDGAGQDGAGLEPAANSRDQDGSRKDGAGRLSLTRRSSSRRS